MSRATNKCFDMQDAGLAPEPSPVRGGKAAPPPPKPPRVGVPSSVLCERGGTEARIDGVLRGPVYPPPAPKIGTSEWIAHCAARGSSRSWVRRCIRGVV
jgi:hypothetical protein